MTKYRLVYFNGRGRAEVARMLFTAAGVDFEDKRVEQEEWKDMKPNTPFGFMPILEVDGVQICNSMAINRYLADKFGFAGSGMDKVRVDEAAELVHDLFNDLVKKVLFIEASKKEESVKAFMADDFPGLIKKIETVFARNKTGSGFLVGNKVSFADFLLHVALEILPADVLATLPASVKKNRETVSAIPKIAEYLKARPDTFF